MDKRIKNRGLSMKFGLLVEKGVGKYGLSMAEPVSVDKRIKNRGLSMGFGLLVEKGVGKYGFSMAEPVSVDKCIKNRGLSMKFGLLVEKPCCGASGGGSVRAGDELSTIQRIEKQYFC